MVATAGSDYRHSEEPELLAGLRAQHALALAEAYHRTVTSVHAVARRLLGSPRDVEELLARVYAELWAQPPQEPPLEGWLRARCFALGSAELRSRQAAPASASLVAQLTDLPRPQTGSETLEQDLTELDETERRVLTAAFDRGLPTTQHNEAGASATLDRALRSLAGPDPPEQKADQPPSPCRDLEGLADWTLGLLDSERAQTVHQAVSERDDCHARAQRLRRGRRRLEGLPPPPDLGHRLIARVLAPGAAAGDPSRAAAGGAAAAAGVGSGAAGAGSGDPGAGAGSPEGGAGTQAGVAPAGEAGAAPPGTAPAAPGTAPSASGTAAAGPPAQPAAPAQPDAAAPAQPAQSQQPTGSQTTDSGTAPPDATSGAQPQGDAAAPPTQSDTVAQPAGSDAPPASSTETASSSATSDITQPTEQFEASPSSAATSGADTGERGQPDVAIDTETDGVTPPGSGTIDGDTTAGAEPAAGIDVPPTDADATSREALDEAADSDEAALVRRRGARPMLRRALGMLGIALILVLGAAVGLGIGLMIVPQL